MGVPNDFTPYYSTLKSISAQTGRSPNNDVTGLDGYCQAWQSAFNGPHKSAFITSQDKIAVELYVYPPLITAMSIGITKPLLIGQLVDTAVQHGWGSDPDGGLTLIKNTTLVMNGTPANSSQIDQVSWMNTFMNLRISDLQNPFDSTTKIVWSQSISRVKSYQYALSAGSIDFPYDMGNFLDNDGNKVVLQCLLSQNVGHRDVSTDFSVDPISSSTIRKKFNISWDVWIFSMSAALLSIL